MTEPADEMVALLAQSLSTDHTVEARRIIDQVRAAAYRTGYADGAYDNRPASRDLELIDCE